MTEEKTSETDAQSDVSIGPPETPVPLPPPGWYPDPSDLETKKYWDGTSWRDVLRCGKCGSKLSGDFCSICGTQNAFGPGPTLPSGSQATTVGTLTQAPSEGKSLGLALFLNFLFPGAGHLYAGVKNDFGIIFCVISGISVLCALTLFLLPVSIVAWIVCAPWTMIDVNDQFKRGAV